MSAGGPRLRRLARYRDIARLLGRYALAERARREPGAQEALAEELESLGPTFVKLGQLLSTRSDLLPEAYVEALSRLQDDVGPFPFEQVRRIVEEELGGTLESKFRSFSRRPQAAASLSQIHKAELKDGTPVAVKVQRPDIRDVIVEDMAALEEAARFLDRHTKLGRRYEFVRLLDEFKQTLLHELDFREEAANLVRLSDGVAEFERLVVPEPRDELTTRRVLVMDWLPGRKVPSLPARRRREIDGPGLADQLFRAYLRQILVDGFFHADPHPGNILLTPDNRIAILDLGMVARVGPQLQQDLLLLLLAISDGRSDDAAETAMELGTRREGFHEGEFRRRVGALVLRNVDATITQLNLGRIVLDIASISSECGLRLPPEMALIGKSLLNLDPVVAALDPDFDPAEAVRRESVTLVQERLLKGFSRGAATSGLLEVQDFAARLPRRLGRALDVLGRNELRVKVDAVDENLVIQGMQKIANRIALGVILASLVIGAALMMRVETSFRIMEYPGLAIILFGAAAVASLLLAIDILYYDEKRRARVRSNAGSEEG